MFGLGLGLGFGLVWVRVRAMIVGRGIEEGRGTDGLDGLEDY